MSKRRGNGQRFVDRLHFFRRCHRLFLDLERRKRQISRGLDSLIYGRASSVCPRCGDSTGPHFVPPSLGEAGFYICDRADRLLRGRGGTIMFDMETRDAGY